MKHLEVTQRIPVCGEYDVIVAGGGLAGAAAAVSAARAGLSVLLLEKSAALGGLGTIGLINFFVPMCNGRGKQIIRGMAEELLRLSVSCGYDTLPPEWRDGEPKEPTLERYVTRYSAPMMMLLLTGWVTAAGVDLMFDTAVSRPVMDGNVCRGLITENKSGTEFYAAKFVIDCTGDADVLRRAGVPTVQGRNYHTYIAHGTDLDALRRAVAAEDVGMLFRDFTGGRANLYGGGHPEGKPYWKGTDGRDVTAYFIENQLELLARLKQSPRSQRDVLHLPMMAQLRTTCHIAGDYTLQVEDAYRQFADSVCAINDFDRRDFLYEVPLRTLCRRDYPNLITAGRSAAADGYAWDVLRVIPPAILTGQAAGLVCAHALREGCGVAEVDIGRLQSALEAADVMVHFDDNLIPAGQQGGEQADVGHL